ncbi:MAG: hypothetical protein JRH13_06415 [Deltaproteobacteria bacterium]|nr:hypothetical protein [Deltaproteobacteria bacterium]MBW2015860.1 hypothetical protein [Deltaproteobacteria bacterium]MBW2128981.1 hypothetical protein [Deltaproteobacteria bacterium]MBW2302924.1 hypothetical protein [Deltaproteobacteria bacterium]
MNIILYLFWAVSEAASTVFLLRGFHRWNDVAGFTGSHLAAMVFTFLIFLVLSGSDQTLKGRVRGKGFFLFMASLSAVPVAGPVLALFVVLFLRYYPIYQVRSEAFEKVRRENLVVFQKQIEARALPITEALLIRGLSRSDALKMLAVVGEMGWSSTKSGLLRYMIRLSPFQNVVLMAIDMLRKKMDEILAEAARIEALEDPDRTQLQRLANLYHEISYLDLCEPVMKQFYQEKACNYAVAAFQKEFTEDDALLSVKYLLEADRVREAREVYETVREKGDYFFPKWITYEFELAVRLRDQETFDNLYLLIESGGGVFIPEKVKEAARAWKTVLTSAWL